MEKLHEHAMLVVQQKKEWAEILTSFETKNKYDILDATGKHIYTAAEESPFLLRLLLKRLRPFTMHILSSSGDSVLRLKRPFRFFFHELHVSDPSGSTMGSIKRIFALFKRKFVVFDSSGKELCTIIGPFFHPWTFHLYAREQECGKISKKWSGFGKELFTDSDNFNIVFPDDADIKQKSILLGALFLIDIVFFESSK